MSHVNIQLNTNSTEQVSLAIIEKMCDLARTVQDCNFSGRLSTNKAYWDDIQYLLEKFSNLYINASTAYIKFQSSTTEQALTSIIGDGVGVSMTTALSLTSITARLTTIDYFPELPKFTNIEKLLQYLFSIADGSYANSGYKNRALISVDLSNIKYIGELSASTSSYQGVFYNCINLSDIGNTGKILLIGTYAFQNTTSMPSEKYYYFPSIQQIGQNPFSESTMCRFILGENFTSISTIFGYHGPNNTGIRRRVIFLKKPATTADVPTITSNTFGTYSAQNQNSPTHAYVPDDYYNTYISASVWSTIDYSTYVHKISDLDASEKALAEAAIQEIDPTKHLSDYMSSNS